VTPHPSASGLFARMAGRTPLADPVACERYVAAAEQRFADRLTQEEASAK
jgi:metallo-beta-lactamase class B